MWGCFLPHLLLVYPEQNVCTHFQGCRLSHACTPVVCWNDVGHIQLTGSWARLASSYLAKAQGCRPDFTYGSWTQVNTSCLLLSSFVRFHVWVKVSSLAFVIRNFRPYPSEFVSQHVAAGLSSNQPPGKKQHGEKKGKQIRCMKEKKVNRKWQDSWKWAASGEECVWLTNDEAKSGTSDHRTSMDAQPSSWRGLRTMKDPLCMNTASRLCRQRRAQAILVTPDLRSHLHNNRERRWFFQIANALAKNKARLYSDFK